MRRWSRDPGVQLPDFRATSGGRDLRANFTTISDSEQQSILIVLEDTGQLVKAQSYRHDYPFHDRCDNALIYFATPSWFIRTSEMRDQLVEANKDITWAPPEVGSGRFGNWLAGNIDWSLSRNRFWGTPLNVWLCDTCDHLHVPRSRAELGELTGADQSDLDLHRPHVDDLTFGCTAEGCGGTMTRTPEVIDCWFDSGSMPFAQYHWPFENEELFANQEKFEEKVLKIGNRKKRRKELTRYTVEQGDRVVDKAWELGDLLWRGTLLRSVRGGRARRAP